MNNVRDYYHKVCASLNKHVGLWAALIGLLAVLAGAYSANATDAEVAEAITRVKADVLTKQEKTIEHVLSALKVLEIRVANGDTFLMIELVLTDLNRLERERKTAPTESLPEIDEALRKRRNQFDDLMDKLRIEESPLD